MSGLRRWSGDPILGRDLAAAFAGGRPGVALEELRDNPRRRILVLRHAQGAGVLLKQFRVGSGAHSRREQWKARLGWAPARREWRALHALHRTGLPVPEPRGLGELVNGDRVLAMRWAEGTPLPAALTNAGGTERRQILEALGEALARIHGAGWVHGDLHAGNVLVQGGRPVFLDWQHSRRSRARWARRRDLAQLDYSLWAFTSRSDRLRLRLATFGFAGPLDASRRRVLCRAERAAERRAAAHAASRTRRSLRPGRLYATLSMGRGRGMRLREVEEGAVHQALRAHQEAVARREGRLLKADRRSRVSAVPCGGRGVIVKETPWRGIWRALADGLRGSAGRRAWLGGHGLLARRIGAARPLAFLEERRLGLPARSWVLLEDLRPARSALEALDAGLGEAGEILSVLTRLVTALHRRRTDHGDLKATHVLIQRGPEALEARLIDLEGVRFRRRLSERCRLRALAQLNASLPDAYPACERRRAFERYARALPFPRRAEEIVERLVALSLARDHRWTGAGCRTLRGSPPSS